MTEPWALPPDWDWASFGQVARVASNLVDPANFSSLPHIAPNHIESETGRLLPYATVGVDAVTSSKHHFYAGQILYSKIRPYLAKVVIVDFDGLCSADMYPVETALNTRYLKWWMLTREFTRRAAGEQARTVLPKINRSALGRLPVPVAPPLAQLQIVEILEDHLPRLDAAADYVSAGARRITSLRRAALDDLFGQSTQRVRLGEIVDRIEAGRSLGGAAAPARDGEWGIIKVSAMTWGSFRGEENKAIPADQAEPKYEVRAGDLLVSRANTSEYVGASVLVGGDVRKQLLLSDKSLRVVPAAGVEPAWLWRVLQSPAVRSQMSALATGTKDSMRNISQKSLLSLMVPKASSAAQREMTRRYSEIDDQARALETQLTLGSARTLALRRAVLAAAFSGKLTGRRTDDEVIEEMAQ